MLTLKEFIAKYDGEFCEMGGSSSAINQCVDLANAKISEVDNQTMIFGTNAVDFPERIGDKYDFILNSSTGFPLAGDVIIFKQYGTRYGVAGHIAVVVSADINQVTMFEENYPTGSVCTTHSRNYLGCRGWLRLKENVNVYKGYDLSNPDSMKVAVDILVELQNGLLVRKIDVDKIISDGNQKLVDAATAYEKEKAIKDEQIKALEESLQKLQDTEHSWSDQADIYQRRLVAILAEFAKVGVSLSPENDTSVLVSAISLYLTNNSAKDVIDILQQLKEANIIIANLKKNDPAFKTMTFGSYIIKFYRK